MGSLAKAGRSGRGLDQAALGRVDAVGVGDGGTSGLLRDVLAATLDAVPCKHSLLLIRTGTGDFRLYTALDDGALIGMPFTETHTVLDDGLRSAHPVVLDDLGAREDAGDILARMFRAERIALAPLRVGDQTVGTLGAVDPADGGFGPEDLTVLALIAARAAVASSWLDALGRTRAEVEDAESVLQQLYGPDPGKTELLSVVSHEVKGPVANVVGFAQLLRREWTQIPSEKREHFLDLIVREGKRAARLAEDVLDLARLESGSLMCDLQTVDVAEVIAETLAANEALRTGHDIVVETAPDLPPVYADRDRAGQVIRNLLSNACSYSPEGTRITVRAARIRGEAGAAVLVCVTDEGPGIPDLEQPELFERFRRLSTSHGAPKGSGLGLYISRGIVEAHGGRIWVKSKPGKGTTFFFTLRPDELAG